MLLDGESPDMDRRLQLIEGERGIGQDERQWYHQFHGSLFPVVVLANAGKYGSLSSLSKTDHL
ncbi:MAG: hypothetical protein NVS4B2_35580 [Chloroflexota bacterium]